MVYFNANQAYINSLLKEISCESIDDLFEDVPAELIFKRDFDINSSMSEYELLDYFNKLASKNNLKNYDFKGAGAYRHHVPALVKYISSRGEFLTSYTPYQAEVSQGTLEAIYLFQSYMADITGMDFANASMYDGATALAESLTMAHRIRKKAEIYALGTFHPEYIEVAQNYLEGLGLELLFVDSLHEIEEGSILAIQNPNFHGELMDEELRKSIIDICKEKNVFLVYSVTESLSMIYTENPSSLGADIVCGSAQSFGNPVFYGGAGLGFIASKIDYVRQMPGRIVGKTLDRNSKAAYVLTFQAREQHIKRERASSNICTNQSIHALSAAVYIKLLGKSGLQDLVSLNFRKAEYLKSSLVNFDFINIETQNTFNEFLVSLNWDLLNADQQKKIKLLFGDYAFRLEDTASEAKFLFAVTETISKENVDEFIGEITSIYKASQDFSVSDLDSIEVKFKDNSYFIEDNSELDVCRFFTRLSQKNFSIDTNFYPLGSCTMKYNPKVNDEIAANSVWNMVHPYEDPSNIQGLLSVYQELNHCLCEITGFDKFSLESAAGAQGEWSALLMAKKYFSDNGSDRHIVIVPDSAHGTNPASAVMAGFKVMTVKSATDGDVDLEHLREICEKNKGKIAVFMLTNPNTLGIFSEKILEISNLIHREGALMYYDGANLNAIVGISRPGDMGFDLIHLNVHKTFATPHGGGGPGAGPVGARGELIKYLPGPSLEIDESENLYWDYDKFADCSIGKVRSFHGNFNVLIRALAYIKRNGRESLAILGRMATLNANYLQERIRSSPILAKNQILQPYFDKACKHEFIISAQRIKKEYGITALDIAKRLLDKGIHAPTIYFPTNVDEALMIEPTETESKQSLDALILALEEIVSEAETDEGRHIIKSAPHTTEFSRFDDVLAIKKPTLSYIMEMRALHERVS